MSESNVIWTIGHSTRTEEEFIILLKTFQIELLFDIRSFPGSRKFPQFNKENLEEVLPKHEIKYMHFKELGGRRKTLKDSKNIAWRSDAFRGYADYMETENFKHAIIKLEEAAINFRTAFMCSEAVWWRCHRSLVSDYLKWKGWKVMHIINKNKIEEHPYTSVASIIDGELTYQNQQSLF